MIASTIHELDLSQLQDQITQLAKNLKYEKDLGVIPPFLTGVKNGGITA